MLKKVEKWPKFRRKHLFKNKNKIQISVFHKMSTLIKLWYITLPCSVRSFRQRQRWLICWVTMSLRSKTATYYKPPPQFLTTFLYYAYDYEKSSFVCYFLRLNIIEWECFSTYFQKILSQIFFWLDWVFSLFYIKQEWQHS